MCVSSEFHKVRNKPVEKVSRLGLFLLELPIATGDRIAPRLHGPIVHQRGSGCRYEAVTIDDDPQVASSRGIQKR